MSINAREYWSGSTKWTIHRNWQRMLINTLWTHRCSVFTKDLPVIKIRVAHLCRALCSPIMCLDVLGSVWWFPHANDGWFVNVRMSINAREYWSGSTKCTFHRNWQRRSHMTKNKNQTKTQKNPHIVRWTLLSANTGH
jgi:hypothetical protein